jgi:integrase
MASISRDKNGNTTIQFVALDGKRRSIRLGKMTKHAADTFKRCVEALAAAKAANLAIDNDTAKWLVGLSDELHGRLAAVGLVVARATVNTELKEFLDAYVASRSDVEPGTLRHLNACAAKLVEFFKADKLLTEIKPGDADEFCSWIRGNRAQATASRMIKRAKQFLNAAVRKEIISKNPFADCKAGHQSNRARSFFITADMSRKVLDACPDLDWRLLFALSRYGAMRCPSEHLALTWADVDWERSRFRVDSPKTGERWVPLFAELRPFLEEAFDAAEPGDVYVVKGWRDAATNLRTRFTKIIRRAGLTPWPRIFHNLRASRQTELAAEFPVKAVCDWVGNKLTVAAEHYLQVTDMDFERAAKSGAVALQSAVQHGTAPPCMDTKNVPEVQKACENVRDGATYYKSLPRNPLTPTGFEPVSRP